MTTKNANMMKIEDPRFILANAGGYFIVGVKKQATDFALKPAHIQFYDDNYNETELNSGDIFTRLGQNKLQEARTCLFAERDSHFRVEGLIDDLLITQDETMAMFCFKNFKNVFEDTLDDFIKEFDLVDAYFALSINESVDEIDDSQIKTCFGSLDAEFNFVFITHGVTYLEDAFSHHSELTMFDEQVTQALEEAQSGNNTIH